MKRYVSLWTLLLTLLMAVLLFCAGTLAYVKIQSEETAAEMRAMAALASDPSELSMMRVDMTDSAEESVSAVRENGMLTVRTVGTLRGGESVALYMPLPGFRSYLFWMGLGSLILTALMQLLALVASHRITRRLQKPLEQINALLNAPDASVSHDKSGIFPEVAPMLDNITSKIDKLHYDMEEVRRTQRIRSDFVANASHELKTPLTSIKGFAELLDGGMAKDESQRGEAVRRILSETNRLLAIIEDILNLSRAERGEPENLTDVNLRAMTEEILRALDALAAQKRIRLEAAGSGTVRANAQEIWELIYNLIDNGIRYGKEGGSVCVRIDGAGFTVVDDGIGIPKEQIPRIFERFYRVDKSHSRQTGGTGLGLSIVRHVAEKYGGGVTVESVSGEGSTFIVTLAPQKEA